MSQSAVVPEQVCLQQTFELSESLEGNEFHRRGPATAKHRLPKVLCEHHNTFKTLWNYFISKRIQ